MNFWNFWYFQVWNFSKNQNSKPSNLLKRHFFYLLKSSKIDFTKDQSGWKIDKFLNCTNFHFFLLRNLNCWRPPSQSTPNRSLASTPSTSTAATTATTSPTTVRGRPRVRSLHETRDWNRQPRIWPPLCQSRRSLSGCCCGTPRAPSGGSREGIWGSGGPFAFAQSIQHGHYTASLGPLIVV